MPLDQLFPGRLEAMRERMRGFATSFGITDMGFNTWLPNTRRALAVTEWARDRGKLDAYRDAAMDAYWKHSKNLSSEEVLGELAAQVGLDRAAAVAASKDPLYLNRVAAMREEGQKAGVRGIPSFLVGGFGFSGAQPYPQFVQVMEHVGIRRR
jgi:predicted DsbA family dithiol-disulfide isomerase